VTRKIPFEGVEREPKPNTIKLGCILQRLFSIFPSGWPGVGLLLLRGCLGIAMICFRTARPFETAPDPIALIQSLIAIACSALLLVGLWTPVMGTVAALNELSIALLRYSVLEETASIHGLLAMLSLSVALLGPGAWSIDSRLFGRKRFDIDRTRGR
jgi:putative oxidoreductase